MLRLMPTGAPDERNTVDLDRDPGALPLALNVPNFRAPFQVRARPFLHVPSCIAAWLSAGAQVHL